MLWPYTMDGGIPQVQRERLVHLVKDRQLAGAPVALSIKCLMRLCGTPTNQLACTPVAHTAPPRLSGPSLLPASSPGPHPHTSTRIQECNFLGDAIGRCNANEKYPGLWEVPLWQLQDNDVLYGVSSELRQAQ